MTAVPKYVTLTWENDVFEPGGDLPAISHVPVLIDDQDVMDAVEFAASQTDPPVVLVFSTTAPPELHQPLSSVPFIRYDKPQPYLTDDQKDLAWDNIGGDDRSGGGGGGFSGSYDDLTDKPDFIGAGSTAAAARSAIGAGTSSFDGAYSSLTGPPDLTLLAPKASPTLTGTPAAPTAAPGTNTTQLATTAFVLAMRDALVNSAPGLLDTLGEIAAQMSTDESALAALITTVSGKQPSDTDLTAIAALVSAADKVAYATGTGTWALADFTSFGRSVAALASAAAGRTLLGNLGSYINPHGGASGEWELPQWQVGTGASTVVTNNLLTLISKDVGPGSKTFTAIGAGCQTAQVGGTTTLSFAIYADDGTGGRPDFTQLLYSGTATAAGAGANSIYTPGSSFTLPPGRYWLAFLYHETSAPGTKPNYYFTNNTVNPLPITTASVIGNTVGRGWTVSSQTALPTTSQTLVQGNAVIMGLKAA